MPGIDLRLEPRTDIRRGRVERFGDSVSYALEVFFQFVMQGSEIHDIGLTVCPRIVVGKKYITIEDSCPLAELHERSVIHVVGVFQNLDCDSH